MSPDEIKTDHCYSMTPIKGRRTIARVTKLFRITAMAAYEVGGTSGDGGRRPNSSLVWAGDYSEFV